MNRSLALLLSGALAAVSASPAAARVVLPDVYTLTATLDGAQVLPFKGDPDGSGTFTATLVRKTGEFCYKLSVSGIAPATGVQIQVGKAGQNDIMILALATPDAEGKSEACVTLKPNITKDLYMLPQYHYVAVQNGEFPAGALRGQLAK